jgi:hypothetical protein
MKGRKMVSEIGEAAGIIWRALYYFQILEFQDGMTVNHLKNDTGLPTSLLYEGLGWLAREGKIELSGQAKNARVFLKGM